MPQEQCRKYIHTHPGNIQKGEDATSQSNRPKKPNEDRVTIKKHRVTNTRTRLLVLVSPPHQVRTAADTASEDDSCGHRRCWTAAASKGLLSLVCVVVVLVAMRFASYTLAFDGHVGRSRVLIHTTKVTDVLSVGCTYLGSRADMRYVRMWYIIPHTKTKISRTRVHACTRADFLFGMYQLETRFARIKNS